MNITAKITHIQQLALSTYTNEILCDSKNLTGQAVIDAVTIARDKYLQQTTIAILAEIVKFIDSVPATCFKGDGTNNLIYMDTPTFREKLKQTLTSLQRPDTGKEERSGGDE